MKKNYIAPTLQSMNMDIEYMIANSILSVGGTAGITKGEGDGDIEEADVNANPFGETLFD